MRNSLIINRLDGRGRGGSKVLSDPMPIEVSTKGTLDFYGGILKIAGFVA